MEITIVFGDMYTTIADNANISLKGGMSWTPNTGDTLTLLNVGLSWVEKSRVEINPSSNGWILVGGYLLATPSDNLMLDAGSYNIDMPATPVFGHRVKFVDGIGDISTRTVIVQRNGQNIMGLAQNMTINVDAVSFDLVFMNASRGWVVVQAGA